MSPTETGPPDEVAAINDEIALLAEAIDTLPPRCREVIILRKIMDMPQCNVAMLLNITERNVEMQVYTGTRRIEEFFVKCGAINPKAAKPAQSPATGALNGAAPEHNGRSCSPLDRPWPARARNSIIAKLQERAKRRQVRSKITKLAACATTAAVIALAVLWPREDAGVPPPGATVAAASVVVTRPEQRVLDDGSTVDLRQGAVIDVRYDDAERRVVLVSGEAHFQVAKGMQRPFVVVAGSMEVRAVGTAFAVELGTGQVEVLVTEGRVVVERPVPPPGAADEEAIAVAIDTGIEKAPAPDGELAVEKIPSSKAGAGFRTPMHERALLATLGMRERAVVEIAPEAGPPVVTPITPAEIRERLAWRASWLEMSETPLAEAVALINRHSQSHDGGENPRLVLDHSLSALKSESVGGRFCIDDIEEIVRVLSMNMNIEGERHGDVIILRKKSK